MMKENNNEIITTLARVEEKLLQITKDVVEIKEVYKVVTQHEIVLNGYGDYKGLVASLAKLKEEFSVLNDWKKKVIVVSSLCYIVIIPFVLKLYDIIIAFLLKQ